MAELTKKVCIIGDFAVGKTSSVARCVNNVFSEKYLTTVGVKIDTKELVAGASEAAVKMIIWDIAGTDRFSAVEFSYLRGSSGFVLVVDGTRLHTLDVAKKLRAETHERYGDLPCVMLINKADLESEWEIDDATIAELKREGFSPFVTSAKTGANVEQAFGRLAEMVVDG
ncbi:MAG: Rab family GTPase [Gammaproteobacteria bacterium]